MKPRILLVNPPIYDFTAYDFWLKPYGMLRVAGFLRGQASFELFDFLDRLDPRVPRGNSHALLYQRNRSSRPFSKRSSDGENASIFTPPMRLTPVSSPPGPAQLMIASGFKSIYLGFESSAYAWQRKTGGKIYAEELGAGNFFSALESNRSGIHA
jgi:hypothetical protein